jgi:Ni/Co efflux regulator RcnB
MMKKIILAAAGASVLIAAPASAQSFGRHDDGRGRTEQVQQQRFGNRDAGQRNFGQRNFGQSNFGQRDFGQRNLQVRQVQTRGWNQGERFDSRYASNYRIIGNSYRNRQAPRGYRWVQSGNDAVLVALASGIIGAIVGNAY